MKTKRLQLIEALLEGSELPINNAATILKWCNITEAQLEEACNNRMLPFFVIEFEYYIRGKRATRQRLAGRIPDGSVNGRAPDA